ncbi:MAG: S-methyl-5-thioribose-1-phosphate isomerase [Candidatus Hodarchaeales archaeon]
MKLLIDGKWVDRPAVWWDDKTDEVHMIDQRKIPFKTEVVTLSSFRETANAINKMIIRGAPSIGAAAAYGLTQAVFEFYNQDDFADKMSEAYKTLLASRPTAVDLKNGLDKIVSLKPIDPDLALKTAKNFSSSIAEEGFLIGKFGKKLISDGINVLTHCHTGALALVDNGSALAPLIQAWNDGVRFHVYVDETRPRVQGRITSWELQLAGVNNTVICDNVSGSLMAQGKIDLIILGADRVTRNGDIANKIGTYNLAVLAKYHKIPFYSAFPTSTFDMNTNKGSEIVIEERNPEEVMTIRGFSREQEKPQSVNLYFEGTKFYNPAFDVTPSNLITGYITPKGILNASELEKKLLSNKET